MHWRYLIRSRTLSADQCLDLTGAEDPPSGSTVQLPWGEASLAFGINCLATVMPRAMCVAEFLLLEPDS